MSATRSTAPGSSSGTDVAIPAPGAVGAIVQRRSLSAQLLHASSGGVISVIVILIALIWSVPTFGLFISSFRPAADVHGSGWWNGLIPPWHFTIANYQYILQTQDMGQAFINSLFISIPGTILPVGVAAFAAYAFAWMKFPGRDWIFLVIVSLMIVPIQMTLIPALQLFVDLNIYGSYLSVWLVHTALGLPFAIYLLRSFFGALPADLFESASIDGASRVRVFFSIVLPLSLPSIASLVIFQFMWVWNDLLVSLILLGGTDLAPMPVKVVGLVNSFGTNYEVMTAAAFLTMILPLAVFFGLQRYFVRGMLAGSVKG